MPEISDLQCAARLGSNQEGKSTSCTVHMLNRFGMSMKLRMAYTVSRKLKLEMSRTLKVKCTHESETNVTVYTTSKKPSYIVHYG